MYHHLLALHNYYRSDVETPEKVGFPRLCSAPGVPVDDSLDASLDRCSLRIKGGE